jgi:heme a synthase
MDTASLVDWSPLARMALLGSAIALGPLLWIAWRQRAATPQKRLHALALLTLFLTFDLVLFGAFTRLTDSGLGCPDWPGCYGSASPIGAHEAIAAAQSAQPSGPVTHGKAWVEMVHRYLATAVGVLIVAMTLMAWRLRAAGRAPLSPWWPTFTLAWVLLQGAFGAWTVTMKLYPAIVTAHLLGGIGLLVLLAVQGQVFVPRPLSLPCPLRRLAWGTAVLAGVQIALGGWVSTNYAVLACAEFPQCQGQWWPPMDFGHAFTPWRELGQTAAGAYLPFEALTAIHMTHRIAALLLLAAMGALAWRLAATGQRTLRRFAAGLVALAALQVATGLSNIVLGWPMVAALLHTGGAAVLAVLLTILLARAHLPLPRPSPHWMAGGQVYENRACP